MGWGSGSRLLSEIVHGVEKSVEDEGERRKLYAHLITCFEDEDCDTLEECGGLSFDLDIALQRAGYELDMSRW